jgi:ABC-type Co2+ transport system permease subunit
MSLAVFVKQQIVNGIQLVIHSGFVSLQSLVSIVLVCLLGMLFKPLLLGIAHASVLFIKQSGLGKWGIFVVKGKNKLRFE